MSDPKKIGQTVLSALLVAAILFGEGYRSPARASENVSAKTRPNVVLITINVLRAGHLSCYGYPRKTTPAIDSLAADSFVFDNAYTQAGYTMPNMMSIFTSLYPDSHQVYDAFKDELSARVKTLAEILKINGYRTGWFAKLDAPHLSARAGFARGFTDMADLGLQLEGKEFIGEWLKKNSGAPFFLAMNVRHTHSPYLPLEKYRHAFSAGLKKIPVETFDQYLQGIYTIFLKNLRDPESPLYNSISAETIAANVEVFNGEYQQWKVEKIESLLSSDKKLAMGDLRVNAYYEMIDLQDEDNRKAMIAYYDACILGIDQEIVKPLVALLKEKGVYANTLIVVTGDHGESLGEHDILGHGLAYYEQLVHVPLIVKLPKEGPGRRDIPGLVESVDILPTILDVVSIRLPHTAQGKSLLPMTARPDLQLHEYVFGENHGNAYIRSRDWKLIAHRKPEGGTEGGMLFDLREDPAELRNVADLHPEMVKTLQEKLDAHLEGLTRYVDRKYEFYPQVDLKTREKIKTTGYW